MKTYSVQIVTLEAMRVASAWGFGEQPEDQAWRMMESWARPQGLLDDPVKARMFGFNNPSPSAGSPNYGYEFCLTVGLEVQTEGDIRTKTLSGGKYAVVPFEFPAEEPGAAIGKAWKTLDSWVADNGYRHGSHQWLEEHTLDGKVIALLYPLAG
jgi:DNA gyrase inhibitor GyrI